MKEKFYLQTKNNTYAMAVDDRGLLRHLYFGKRLVAEDLDIPDIWDSNSNHSDLDNAMLEYTVFGGKLYRNIAFKCKYSDGCRDSVFLYKDSEKRDNELVITLEDKAYDAEIKLHYITYDDTDVITRYAEIINNGDGDLIIDKMMSGEISLPSELPYDISNTNGSWGAEFQIETSTLKAGYMVFDSRKGTTGHTNQPTIIASQNATEDAGDVFFAALGYSGSFKVEAQRDFRGITRAMLGVNDFDFSYTLKPGDSITTPKLYVGYAWGFASMSNQMNKFAVNHILPKEYAKKPLPVLYNSWEATWFDVNTKDQLAIAKRAAQLGCELFVMDDGWFGERSDDHQGLGDWYVNKTKFPNGIAELIDGVNALGMDFGLWFEPEMVQKHSQLYAQHPDWIYHYPTRANNELRNQLVLNLTKPDVEDFVYSCMDNMLSQYNIRYIKWDMNRPFSEIGADNLANPQELWYRHTQAVYRIADRLRAKYPYIQIEACASGGGRADLGALEHFDMVWTSDNTDPLDRLTIQQGFSQLYPIKCMRAWVTDSNASKRPTSLDFRFASSMQGSLSIGANLNKYDNTQMQIAKDYISLYKDIRNTIQFGNVYRLRNNKAHEYWATEYADETQSVLFVMTNADTLDNKHRKHLTLKGLDEKANYKYNINGKEYTKTGATLMHAGINIDIWDPLDAKIIRFQKVD